MQAAHYNAVENLVVFAALVLVAQDAGVSNNATIMACMIYFWARVAHLVAYTSPCRGCAPLRSPSVFSAR
jgi:uncharacterized MAPEG superfamily protein